MTIPKNLLSQGSFRTGRVISIITYRELLYGAKRSEQTEKNCAKVYRLKNLFPVILVGIPVIEVCSDIKSKYGKVGKS
jgi:tRNA(fMet)-specific endonuclease VapC